VPARAQAKLRVVVVGGGFAGATCARYLKLWAPALDVTLVEPQSVYTACPMSNRLLGGTFYLRDLARDYGALSAAGVRVVRARVLDADAKGRSLKLDNGTTVACDRLVLAPGIEFDTAGVEGLAEALDRTNVLHAWQGGTKQVWELRTRIEGMRRGGVVALHIPRAPYRCPPGPYERASLIAYFLSRRDPTAKVLVFDTNPDILSKRDLFASAWKDRYPRMIEYVPNTELQAVDPGGKSLRFKDHGEIKADVLNVIPAQRAPQLARQLGLVPRGQAWCPVDFRTYESTLVPGVHVIGDAIASAPGLPKSGHMANQTAKVCAAAIVASATGEPLPAAPVIANTCYSFIDANEAMHVAGVYRYDPAQRTMVIVKESAGTSPKPNAAEAVHAIGWAQNILYDAFGATFTLQV
jgi:NADPH-dependent 2,4-dienoyl-CoA reductase/sulfur reductase-like enzyme